MSRALLSTIAVAAALAILASSPPSGQARPATMTAIAMAESGGNSNPSTRPRGSKKWSDIVLKPGRTDTRKRPTVRAK
jgi:hypothetical protein